MQPFDGHHEWTRPQLINIRHTLASWTRIAKHRSTPLYTAVLMYTCDVLWLRMFHFFSLCDSFAAVMRQAQNPISVDIENELKKVTGMMQNVIELVDGKDSYRTEAKLQAW